MKAPLKTPQGVRTAEIMYASSISFLRVGDEAICRCKKAGGCCGPEIIIILRGCRREMRSAGDAMMIKDVV